MTTAQLRYVADRLTAELSMSKAELKVRKERLAEAEERYQTAITARQIVQDLAQAVQQKVHERIAGVVSKCLAAVFPRPYTFHIVFVKKRGKTEAELEFRRDGHTLRPREGVGGSVLDVAAFALRLACLGLQRPKRRKLVVIDEGFRGVSKRQMNKKRTRKLLETLASELGFQIIQVSHDVGFRAGTVVEI